MFNCMNYKNWLLAGFLAIAPITIAVGQSSSVDAQFKPSQTIINSDNLSATKAAAAQSMQQVQAYTKSQQQKNDVYFQQVMQQISAVGKIPETTNTTATTSNQAVTPAVSTQPATAKQPAAKPQQTTPQPPPTATGLPETNNAAPASGGAESWPLGF